MNAEYVNMYEEFARLRDVKENTPTGILTAFLDTELADRSAVYAFVIPPGLQLQQDELSSLRTAIHQQAEQKNIISLTGERSDKELFISPDAVVVINSASIESYNVSVSIPDMIMRYGVQTGKIPSYKRPQGTHIPVPKENLLRLIQHMEPSNPGMTQRFQELLKLA